MLVVCVKIPFLYLKQLSFYFAFKDLKRLIRKLKHRKKPKVETNQYASEKNHPENKTTARVNLISACRV